jgi:hypothetical protein
MSQELRTIQHNALQTQLGSASSRALAFLQKRQQAGAKNELADGIQTSFAILGYRGKVWRMKYQGNEQDLMRVVDGVEEPVPSVAVILVRAASGLSKNWYEKGYVEGSNEAPDCYSVNGINPEPTSPKRQSPVCATCPHNQFGSRVSADGTGRGKACGDSKRIVIVPEGDIDNEDNGGPMLLRIPAASLGDLGKYALELERAGYPYMGVSTRLYFDSAQAYPKILMKAVRPLTDEQFAKIEALYEDPRTLRILDGSAAPTDAAALPAPAQPLFEAGADGVVEQTPTPAPVAQTTQAVQPNGQPAQAETDEEREFREFQAAKKAKAEAEARAKAEAEARAAQEAEAARQAAQTAQQPKEETEEERELREFREHRAQQKAQQTAQAASQPAPATPASTQAPPAATPAPAPSQATQTASADDADANAGNLPAGFDQMLSGLMG